MPNLTTRTTITTNTLTTADELYVALSPFGATDDRRAPVGNMLASATVPGFVSTAAQSFAGAKTFTTSVTITPPADIVPLTISGYSVTGAATTRAVSVAGTWNTTGAPVAFEVDIVNTASAATSRLESLRIGGTDRWFVNVGGNAQLQPGRLSVGTVASAGAKVYLRGTSNADSYFQADGSTGVHQWGGGADETNVVTFTGSISNHPLQFRTNNTEVGRFGITGLLTLSPAANTGMLFSNTYSVTGAGTTRLIDLAGTLNTTGTVDVFLVNITNTASNAATTGLRIQASSVDRLSLTLSSGNLEARGDIMSTIGDVRVSSGRFFAITSRLSIDSAGDGLCRITNGTATTGATLNTIALTPAAIAANTNNYNPGGSSYLQRWSSTGAFNITGLTFPTAQQDGQLHFIVNVGANNIVITNQDILSTDINRFITGTGASITLAPDDTAIIVYDSTTSRWRVFA